MHKKLIKFNATSGMREICRSQCSALALTKSFYLLFSIAMFVKTMLDAVFVSFIQREINPKTFTPIESKVEVINKLISRRNKTLKNS